MSAPVHSSAGWHNFCQRCGQRYWVASKDINQPKMRRWTDESCTTRHVCPDFGPETETELDREIREVPRG